MRKSELEYIRYLNDLIYGCRMRYEELRSKAYPGAIVYDDIGGSRPAPINKLERVYEMMDQADNKMNKLAVKRYKLKERAIYEIQNSGLETAERHIMYLRYLATDPRSGRNFEWSDVYKYVHKYHNIGMPRIYQLHHDAVELVSLYNI